MSACWFLAGYRHLIQQKNPEYEWIGTLSFGAGLVYATLTLVADSLEGASALDTVGGVADPSAIRALTEGQILMFGSVALILIALIMVAGSYAMVSSKLLPKWTGWVGYGGATACVAFIPSMFSGSMDFNSLYSASGWGPTAVVAAFPFGLWTLVICLLLIRNSKIQAKIGAVKL